MDAAVVEEAAVERPPARRRPDGPARWPGVVAVAAGILTALLVVAGILAAESDAFVVGWWLALAAVGSSLLAVLAGIGAVAGGWGRVAGVAGIVLGIAANPLLLVWGLDLLEGL